MSELQTGLLSIGALLIVAVYLYGFWQQRRFRSKYGQTFKSAHDDALYQPDAAIVDQLLDEEASDLVGHEVPQRSTTGDEIYSLMEAETDYVVSLKLDTPQNSSVLAPLWEQRFDFGKNVNACGLNAATGRWERLIPESMPSYSAFKIGLQLADRSGPVSETRLANFHSILNEIGKNLQAEMTLPAVANALAQAKLLDEFCAEVDRMIGLNILPSGDRLLFGSEVAKVAELHAMPLQSDGAFHRLDGQGLTLFSLASQDGAPFQHHTLSQVRVQGLTLLLDVPRVEQPAQRFDEMITLAHELAAELRCGLADDRRIALSDAALGQIREQVAAIEKRMLQGNIIPGSAQALRLFS